MSALFEHDHRFINIITLVFKLSVYCIV